MLSYQVLKYSFPQLRKLMREHDHVNPNSLKNKPNLKYFKNYFSDVGAKTIVVERPYIDRGFMEDYSGYYARCFLPYDRSCLRLHFFDRAMNRREFSGFLKALPDSAVGTDLNEHYLGFIVVKPLPETIIGRTCLRTYSREGRRYYPTIRGYPANLFGLELTVETLPFQEQDRTVSACATSALWSALQATSKLFQHQELSPVEITTVASERFPLEKRSMPTAGLDAVQMAEVIRSAGMESIVVKAEDNEYVIKSTLYAYLKGGIPVIMGLRERVPREFEDRLHAIAVTGFSLGMQHCTPCPVKPGSRFALRASRIDELYAHDDGVGPFARMFFATGGNDSNPDALHSKPCLRTPIGEKNEKITYPLYLLVPHYHKVRIPFETVFSATHDFDRYLREFGLDLPGELEWEIFLTSINDVKSEVFQCKCGTALNRTEVLLRRMPRFIWRSIAYDGSRPVLELLFDATDIEQGKVFVCPIVYDLALAQKLPGFAKRILKAGGGKAAAYPLGSILSYFAERVVT